jgi:hypothetical protein
MEKDIEDIFKPIKELNIEMGLNEDFLFNLVKEDDWSFIIKLHALVEAVTTRLIVKQLGNDKLEDILSEIQLSNKKTGKIAFLKALDLLNKQRAFISCLSEIRNFYVHKIANISLSLNEYFKSLPTDKLKGYANVFVRIPKVDKEKSREEYLLKSPKFEIYTCALIFINVAYIEKNLAEQKRSKIEKGLQRLYQYEQTSLSAFIKRMENKTK